MSDHHRDNDDDDERWERLELRLIESIAQELSDIRTTLVHQTSAIHRLHEGQTHIMANIDDLNAAIIQLSIDLGEAVTRIEAKIAAGNPDLQPEVDAIRAASATLDALAADPPVA